MNGPLTHEQFADELTKHAEGVQDPLLKDLLLDVAHRVRTDPPRTRMEAREELRKAWDSLRVSDKHRCRDHVEDPEKYRCEAGEHIRKAGLADGPVCPCQKCSAARWMRRTECFLCRES